jgi:hypothetical protein
MDGRIEVTVGLRTVNRDGADVPFGVVTTNGLEPVPASVEIEIDTGSEVEEPPGKTAAVTPAPPNITAVAPDRANPLMVALKDVPTVP